MKTIFLVRHAQSLANAGEKTANPADIPITELGKKQASHISDCLVDLKPEFLIASPYIRTQQTAAPTATRLTDISYIQWPVQEFTYLSPLRWANTCTSERIPAKQEYLKKNEPRYNDGDGAESFVDLVERIDTAIAGCLDLPQERIMIFTHGHFMKAFWWRTMFADQAVSFQYMRHCTTFMESFAIPNTAILQFNKRDIGWRVEMKTSHIKEFTY